MSAVLDISGLRKTFGKTHIIRGLDLTAEFARHDVTTRRGLIHPDEWLVVLRALF